MPDKPMLDEPMLDQSMRAVNESAATDSAEVGARYLHDRLTIVAARVAAAVARRRADDPDPSDRFRGLYISEAQVDSLLDGPPAALLAPSPDGTTARAAADLEAWADDVERAGGVIRLRRLARGFGLTELDIELLLVALAPDLEPRFERLYGYLHDDVSRRRASAGLALELSLEPSSGAGATASGAGLGGGRARLDPAAPLIAGGLVIVEDPDRPFLTRSLRVPDRVAGHLLGIDDPDPIVAGLLTTSVPAAVGPVDGLERALDAGSNLVYIRERVGSAGLSLAATALAAVGAEPVLVDLGRLAAGDDPAVVAAVAVREARLRGGGLIAGPIDGLAERGAPAIRAFAEAACPTILLGVRGWDPGWSRNVPLLVDAVTPTTAERSTIWRAALADAAGSPGIGGEIERLPFRLAPEQVVRAARSAALQAVAEGGTLEPRHLYGGARAQNAAGLERLARRIEPVVAWPDLVLPRPVLGQLRELAARARHRDLVLDEWGMGRRSSKGRGITALFAGDSGTGKTMSAEVIAGELGLDLYVIDLSTVVDKYIGETEKNLDRVFSEADRVNGILLFDEADSIFGKRSEVKDARDRYANVEVAYLLQRMEQFDGMAILTTNLRSNVDEAFVRRLDAIIDFPMPEFDDRLRIWRTNLPPSLPLAGDIDHEFLARAFKLSGGNIRNVAVGAAYRAAEAARPVAMIDLVRETEREYRKLGRLVVESEFGPHFRALAEALAGGDPEPGDGPPGMRAFVGADGPGPATA
ncbi:MAG TPA: ATP-binding protein [Candidatus Limnocylindrales bacterium]